jgi:2-amino-4-hydroxy-6-hydroxymethyldihydropteridine diphosphokinase
MNTAYIALGSNISPRFFYLEQAIEELKAGGEMLITSESAIYETKPVGYTEQDNFLNMVVEVQTSYTAKELLVKCLRIEEKLGRKREIRWGPRIIDLDILVYNQENIKSEQLMIPHPRMHERAFVLIPLCDINPNLMMPTLNKRIIDILAKIPATEKEGVIEWIRSTGESGSELTGN